MNALGGRLPVGVTEHPIDLSTRILDGGEVGEATNRITNRLHELADGLSIVESFSHIVTFDTSDGLVCVDSSGAGTGGAAVTALREWSNAPIHSLVYTHGHLDHVGGSPAMAVDATDRGAPQPEVLAHEAVAHRFERYRLTSGFNKKINARQFGGISKRSRMEIGALPRGFLPDDVLEPTVEYQDTLDVAIGGRSFELRHDKGETDDHTWVWVPDQKAICAGDLVTWVFPNCGNPQKVQRFPKEWAAALRKMQTLKAEMLIGAHGLPIIGAERVDRVLDDLATALESLVVRTIDLMNEGAPLDTILHEVTLPADVLERPWMLPIYDEPEFVVRNIWRRYGGWWDQDPAQLKPAPKAALAAEVVEMSGGEAAVLARAQQLAADADFRLACHLVEMATQANPDSAAAHAIRAEIYQSRRNSEASLMSKGIFAAAANESAARLEELD